MEYNCGNLAEWMINRTKKLIIKLDDSNNNTNTIVVANKQSWKRAATVLSLKQRRHKQLKTSAPPPLPENTHFASDSLGRRPSRRRKPTTKVREQAQWDKAEAQAKAQAETEIIEAQGGGGGQLTLSQFKQTEPLVRRLEAMTVAEAAKR